MLEATELGYEQDGAPLFDGLSFCVRPGERIQITGGNGAGKTTLLRILTGLLRPSHGDVRWAGEPLHHLRGEYHRQMLWIGHQPGVKTGLTPLENLRFFHCDRSPAACMAALAVAGLAGYDDLPVSRLSAGQQRRAVLARLWLTRAPLWLLDEPFTAIDVHGAARLMQRIADHTAQGGMVILTSHQPLPVTDTGLRRIALTPRRECRVC